MLFFFLCLIFSPSQGVPGHADGRMAKKEKKVEEEIMIDAADSDDEGMMTSRTGVGLAGERGPLEASSGKGV